MRGVLGTFGWVMTALWMVALVDGLLAGPALAEGEAKAAPPPKACECPPCDPYPCCDCKKPEKPTCPPKAYGNCRFEENWRPCLCLDPCDLCDWADRVKAVPFTRGAGLWGGVGGQVRARYEVWRNQAFGAPPSDADDEWLLLRVRAHGDVHLGDCARVFVEGNWAYQWTRELGPRPIDVNHGDLLNAFGEVTGKGVVDWGARVGRQELLLGKQRLISPLDWANTRRTFDGARAWAKRGPHQVDAFYVTPVTFEPGPLDDEFFEDSTVFWGLYYRNTALNCVSWDAYLLGLERDVAPWSGVTEDESRLTVGARADWRIPRTRVDVEAEGGWQFGSWGDGDVSASFLVLEVGWKPCWGRWEPRLAAGLDWASGDDDDADADVGTFHQLFPLGHAYLGHADLVGRQNVVAARVEATVKPTKKLTARAWMHWFWRADENDALYNAAGGVQRAPGGSDELYVGSEFDLWVQYQIARHWSAIFGWAHFFAGDFLSDTGADDDVDFLYLEFQWTI